MLFKILTKKWILLFVMFFFSVVCLADEYKVAAVTVSGNRRIDADAILNTVKAKKGLVTSDTIDADIRELYRMGFFEQITASFVTKPEGRILRYVVVEKPTVRKVFIKGNEEISESDLVDVLSFGDRRFVDKTAISAVIRKAISYYQSHGFYDASFTHSVAVVGENQVDVTFTVDEGNSYKIREIVFQGLETVNEDELKEKMFTKRYKWWNSWLYSTGRLNREALANDRNIIRQFLFDHGLIDAQVSEATVEKIEDDTGLRVVFEVVEGDVYSVGTITANGDFIDSSMEATLDGIDSETGGVFNASMLREDSFKISEKFSDIGYAYVNVVPNTLVDRERRSVNVDFEINKGKLVNIDKISIRGNEKTYDNVIRRELKVHEQDVYSGTNIKRSKVLLERLGYFEEVNITTVPTKDDNKVNLDVDVREAATGAFSVGAGYSTADGALFNIKVSENNFFGTGRQLSLNIDVGTESDNIILSANDRRVNDSNWGLGAELMKIEREYDDFDREQQGGSIVASYPLEEVFGSFAQDIDFALRYQYLDIDITNVNHESAAPLVIRSEGNTTASSITPSFIRNTINNPINPTRGSRQQLDFEYAGIGGKSEFWLAQVSNTWYQPIYRHDDWGDLVFSWRIRFGYGKSLDDEEFPLFKRFFPGGINSIRGYDERSMGPVDADGNEYGGSKQLINNLELIFPLVNSAGLKGIVFYDIGEAFDDHQSIKLDELRKAYGFGLRWSSPLGPIRIEFGFPCDRRESDRGMVTMFSFGAPL